MSGKCFWALRKLNWDIYLFLLLVKILRDLKTNSFRRRNSVCLLYNLWKYYCNKYLLSLVCEGEKKTYSFLVCTWNYDSSCLGKKQLEELFILLAAALVCRCTCRRMTRVDERSSPRSDQIGSFWRQCKRRKRWNWISLPRIPLKK